VASGAISLARVGRRNPRKKLVLNDEALELVAARFRSLGDPSRLRLLNVLMTGERSVQQLVEETGLSQTNVSRHLGLLRREGLVARQSQGNRALYRLQDESLVKLCEIVCDGLTGRLADELEALPEARAWRGYGI
jgi:DNA-binding transcriptional ArsR family regulator